MALGKAYVNISANLKPLQRGLSSARAMVIRGVGVMAKAAKGAFGIMAAGLRKIISLAKMAAIALAGIIVGSVKGFASFEEQLANIATMLDEQTMKFMPRYEKELTRLSIKFGESTKTLSAGLYAVLSASIPAEKALGVLEIAARAAQAGITDTGTAVKAIVSILNAYGMSADKAGKVSDILFAAVKKGQTTFAELASTVGQATAIAASAGVSFEEVAAAIATITRGGISTAETVTALRMAIIALQGRTKEAVKIAKEHGVELSVTALNTKGLVGVLKELKRVSPTVLASMFAEVRARVALNTLLKDQEGFLKDYNTTTNASGMTQEAYAKQIDLLSLSFKQLWQTVKATGVTIGGVFREDIKRGLDKFKTWLEENQGTIEVWAKKVREKIHSVALDLLSLYDMAKGGDWESVFGRIGELMAGPLAAIQKWLKTYKPLAIDLGKKIGQGFYAAIKATPFGKFIDRASVNIKAATGTVSDMVAAPAAVAGSVYARFETASAERNRTRLNPAIEERRARELSLIRQGIELQNEELL